jgi:frataxin
MTEAEFLNVINTYIEQLYEKIESIYWQKVDCQISQDVLKIEHTTSPSLGTFVINRNVPRRELWLASPISGGSHYVYSIDRKWKNTRTNASFEELLFSELDLLQ